MMHPKNTVCTIAEKMSNAPLAGQYKCAAVTSYPQIIQAARLLYSN